MSRLCSFKDKARDRRHEKIRRAQLKELRSSGKEVKGLEWYRQDDDRETCFPAAFVHGVIV